jgi:hypothetical protein
MNQISSNRSLAPACSRNGHGSAGGRQFLIDLARQTQKMNKTTSAAQMIDHPCWTKFSRENKYRSENLA